MALAGGIDPSKIEVHGNNKSLAEIDRAVSVGVKTIVMDSLHEIDRVAAMARKHGVVQGVMLRLTPGIQAHTHESISTAHEDVKFGFSIASGAAWAAVEATLSHPELELRGFHSHIGSQIFGTESFELAADRLISLLAKYRDTYSKELPVYGIHFRDELTGFPVIAKLSLVASSIIDGTYRGSDILVNNQRKLKASLRIDSEGYYSKDIFEHLIPSTTHHDTIFLAPITHGAITKLDDIYFAGGLAIILEESMPRLKRLKDFLLLNPSISIEVQGHVNDEGGNSLSSQRLSKKRAKRIVEYLISCGIEPERLSAVGYGNTKPIYPKPESEEQKEANRRVEVKIK